MSYRPLPWGAVILLMVAQAAMADHSVEYLYIEANSGTSSGGHVAVKLDETVYHFQNKDGLILLQRDAWPRFRHLYADLDNRDIHVAKVNIPDPVQIEIKRHLDLSHLKQNFWLEHAASMDRDVALLEALSQKKAFAIPGAGFFGDRKLPSHGESFILGPIETAQSIRSRLQTIIKTRRNLHPGKIEVTPEAFNPADLSRGYADEWIDLTQNQIALEWALGQKELNQAVLMDGGALPPEERPRGCSAQRWLSGYKAHLKQDAARLLFNPYPGSGLPLLRTLARYEAVKLSLERGRLYLLSPGLTSTDSNRRQRGEYLESPQSRLETEFRQHLNELSSRLFCSTEIDDLSYHKLELATLDLKEVVVANQQKMPVGFDHEPDLPNAPALITPDPWESSRTPETTTLERALEARERLQDQITERMHYNLITRNCVTELIKAINSGFEENREPPELRGHIDPYRSQSFVPFRFFELVLRRYPVESTTTIRSFRHRRLAEMILENDGPWTGILEGNTLTGSVYRPRDEDGIFLFFTDESLWSRPLLGVANLGAAMGAMALGIATLPLDQGHLLEAGARGALFSLPEIGLWNIRKGSFTEATLRNER